MTFFFVQFALTNDILSLLKVTRGGGALTLASQWKSQFDDSEETTDNEWKQEPQVWFIRVVYCIPPFLYNVMISFIES